jgi:preprotein translocase subunit SecG
MTILIAFLTLILVLLCLLLMLLVLIQLPKKEAGSGLAFGGGATEALFGAGSGNALTKITKYIATAFVGLSLTLAVINANRADRGDRWLELELERQAATETTGTTPAPLPEPLPAPAPTAP